MNEAVTFVIISAIVGGIGLNILKDAFGRRTPADPNRPADPMPPAPPYPPGQPGQRYYPAGPYQVDPEFIEQVANAVERLWLQRRQERERGPQRWMQ